MADYVERNYLIQRSLVQKSEYLIRHSCAVLEKWMLRENLECSIEILDELLLSRWVKWLELLYAPRSVKRMRGDVLGVLCAAADDDLRSPIRHRRVRRPSVPPPIAKAWSIETIQKIILTCRLLIGTIETGVLRSLYFETIYRAAWCLALRRSDLIKLRLADIRPDGRVWIVQNKTRILTDGKLGAEEIHLLNSFGYDCPLQWPHAHSTFYDISHEVKRLAGIIEPGHLNRFRKSAATDVAKKQGRSAATKLLGHTNPAADLFYIDPTMLDEQPIEPTKLNLGLPPV